MSFALHEHPTGVVTAPGRRVVYDLERDLAWFGEAEVAGAALVFELDGDQHEPVLAAEVELDAGADWVVRCDRVDFPPGGIAYRHVHPGPGIRRILHGALTIDRGDGAPRTYRTGESWLEGADDPVLAMASESEETAFVRVLLLPAEWAGKRTIRYLDPADEARPKLQRATVLLEEPLS